MDVHAISEHVADWKPALSQKWLLVLAGCMWCVVGLMLLRLSWVWSSAAGWIACAPFLGIGLLVCSGTQLFFRQLAARNIDRIRSLPEKACLFAFQSWTSYPLVAFMMALGIALRSSTLPRSWMAGAYLAIGASLLIAGLGYFPALMPDRHKVRS